MTGKLFPVAGPRVARLADRRGVSRDGTGKGNRIVKRLLTRYAVVMVAAVGLNACGGLFDGSLLQDSFWANSPLKDNDEAELGLAEMTKGNYVAADSHYQKALKANPKDVHALLGQGLMYQHTGQATKARENFEAVLAIRPEKSKQMVILNDLNVRPVSEIASVRLALLDSGGVVSQMARPAGQPAGAAPMAATGPGAVSGLQTGSPMLGRTASSQVAAVPRAAPAPMVSGLAPTAGGDANIMSRYETMVALRDQGLITQQEFATRRQANIGALLPLTSPPPAAGLGRPVPNTGQITNRLKAIGRALEMRAMTVGQHSSERAMILDALMPAAPVAVAAPRMPPKGLMEAADAVRRLESLKAGGFITSDEYTKERTAIEKSIAPRGAAVAKPKPTAQSQNAQPRAGGPRSAVHLASYRSKKAAARGWAQIRRAYRTQLGKLKPEVTRVNLGPGKGAFYRLKAGPLRNKAAADKICSTLKRRRQYCEPSFMQGN